MTTGTSPAATAFTIYGKPNCKFCDQAKITLSMKGLTFIYQEIGKDLTREELIDKCPAPVRSVPQIFCGSEYVGGYEELEALLRGESSTDV